MQNKNCFTGRLDVKAFTLIELLVVVLIIDILAAVALPQYQKAVLKSRYTQLMTFGNAVHQAAANYHLVNGRYPARFDELSIDVPGTGDGHTRIYQNYACHIYNEPGVTDVMRCWFTTSAGDILGYRVLLDGRRFCETSYQWEIGNNLCKNMTNTSVHVGNHGDGNSGQKYLRLYVFN